MKVSIIVAIYNVEKYLDKCLDSLCKQTYSNIEILCINDETEDLSQEIVAKYLLKYPEKIKSYIKKNGGLSDCRNFGIGKSTGEYLAFIDGDDYVDENYILKLVDSLQINKTDIAICNIYNAFKSSIEPINCFTKTNNILEYINIYPSAWNKMFSKDFLLRNKLEFKKDLRYEDVNFIYKCIAFKPKLSYVEDNLYYYVQRKNSMVRANDGKINDLIIGFEDVIDFYRNLDLFEENYELLEVVMIRYFKMTYLKLLAMNENKMQRKKMFSDSKTKLEFYFPNYKKNKYVKKNIKLFIYVHVISFFLFELMRKFLQKRMMLKDLVD